MRKFCISAAVILKEIKSGVGDAVAFLALGQSVPGTPNKILLPIVSADEGEKTWADRIDRFLKYWRILSNELEFFNGPDVLLPNLHFWEVWGDSDGPLIPRIIRIASLSLNFGRGRITLGWWSGLLKALRPRIIYPRKSTHDLVRFTDAERTAMIMVGVTLRNDDFDNLGSIMSCKWAR